MALWQEVNDLSGEQVQLCYHCHKCTAGCPVAADMQYGPDALLRMVQLGQREAVLRSADIWLCAGCEACGARCPNDIDIARMMDALRVLAVREGVQPALPSVPKFNTLFMEIVRHTGRMHELSLMGLHKLWTLNLVADVPAGLRLILKGKIPLLPEMAGARKEVARLYENAEEGLTTNNTNNTNPEESV